MTENDITIQEPIVEGEVLDYPDKCDQVDAEGRIVHSPFCGLNEQLGKKRADLRSVGLRIPLGWEDE